MVSDNTSTQNCTEGVEGHEVSMWGLLTLLAGMSTLITLTLLTSLTSTLFTLTLLAVLTLFTLTLSAVSTFCTGCTVVGGWMLTSSKLIVFSVHRQNSEILMFLWLTDRWCHIHGGSKSYKHIFCRVFAYCFVKDGIHLDKSKCVLFAPTNSCKWLSIFPPNSFNLRTNEYKNFANPRNFWKISHTSCNFSKSRTFLSRLDVFLVCLCCFTAASCSFFSVCFLSHSTWASSFSFFSAAFWRIMRDKKIWHLNNESKDDNLLKPLLILQLLTMLVLFWMFCGSQRSDGDRRWTHFSCFYNHHNPGTCAYRWECDCTNQSHHL